MSEKILENEEIFESTETEVTEPEVEVNDSEAYEASEGSGVFGKVLKGVGIAGVGFAAGYAVKRFVAPKVKGIAEKLTGKKKSDKQYAVTAETKDGVRVMSLREIRDKEVSEEEAEKEE